jgi:gamma-glutamyltranspeptidase/glutathione hydrolase
LGDNGAPMWFNSRRSPVYGTRGAVATSQPLASEAGMRILQRGGNAADAAVAVAAALNVTEPCSTGMGGDCFALFYDAKEGRVLGLNGSGRAPIGLTPEKLFSEGLTKMPSNGVNTITVPGAVAGWVDAIEKFGTFTIGDVLTPAIELAEDGFPVSPLTARAWASGVPFLKSGPYGDEMLINGRAPGAGEVMKNPTLAHSMREVAEHGKAGFYEGRIAEAIVELIHLKGGTMTLDDLKRHITTFDEPITVNYRGVDVWEIPPNGQGITALIALNIVEGYNLSKLHYDSPQRLHFLIEAIRTAFADTRWYVADSSFTKIPVKELISKDYAAKRREHINPLKATLDRVHGSPSAGSDTVYFCMVDRWGNACSFINSNYSGFGTGLVPRGCGFTLQNRGAGFTLEKGHPNVLSPGKRPYHTIIPGMMTKDGELFGPFGVMGGFMQPQGHLQVITNMIDYGMDPQEALNAPRFCIQEGIAGGKVSLEEGISLDTMAVLARMGHEVIPIAGHNRVSFGKGQIILRDSKTGALTAGSDPRSDGQALGW